MKIIEYPTQESPITLLLAEDKAQVDAYDISKLHLGSIAIVNKSEQYILKESGWKPYE